MKKISFTILLALAACVIYAQSIPVLGWAKQQGGTSEDYSSSIITDAAGNIITTGFYAGSADFDPDITGTFMLNASGGTDIFISKLNSSGNLVWAKTAGGNFDDRSNSITQDASGNMYITGTFAGTADFGVLGSIVSFGLTDVFVLKLDASGSFIWVKQIGGTGGDAAGVSVSADPSGNVFITGMFSDTTDFDPGTSTFNLTSSGPGPDAFIAKLDGNGSFLWAKQLDLTGVPNPWNNGYGSVTDIKTDAGGNACITGCYSGTVDLDPGSGTFNVSMNPGFDFTDIFILKLDAAGDFAWAQKLNTDLNVDFDSGNSIAIDPLDNVYVSGFCGTCGLGQAVFYKLNSSGNLLWQKYIGSVGSSTPNVSSIIADDADSIIISGTFQGMGDFDPGASIFNLTASGINDAFVCKLDSAGNFGWALSIEGAGDFVQLTPRQLAKDNTGNLFLTGGFNGTCDFDPGTGTFNLFPAGMGDIYVVKLGQGNVGINNLESENSVLQVYPNPATDHFVISFSAGEKEKYSIKLFDATGRMVLSKTGEALKDGNVIDVNTSTLSRGIYSLQFVTDAKMEQVKVVVQ